MIHVLFCEKLSVYDKLPVIKWDIEKNAYNFKGDNVVITHPPCRLWSRMRKFSTAPACEKLTAIFALNCVRSNGGILEHPMGSSFWKFANLPLPGQIDNYGGFSICVNQSWWGHLLRKSTMLYIAGCSINDIPAHPLNFNLIEYVMSSSYKKNKIKRDCKRKFRNATPIKFALYLIEIASIIQAKKLNDT